MGTFAYACEDKPDICQVEGCSNTYQVYRSRATGIYACKACRDRYTKTGKFEKMVFRRKTLERIPICEVCRERKAKSHSKVYHLKRKWRCYRCRSYAYQNRKERPRQTRYTREKVCTNCGRNTEAQRDYYLCYMCKSHKINHGVLPDKEHIRRFAPHGWCECGKRATQFVPDLQTGVLRVNPTLTGSNDTVSEQTHEYGEWMCDDCAEAEYEMRGVGGNEYRPTGFFNKREAAD